MKKQIDKMSIYELLQAARNSLIKNDDCMRQLLFILTGIDEKTWKRQQCVTSFINIIKHYANEQNAEMILDISGVSGKYTEDTASKRRNCYLETTEEDDSTQSKRENNILKDVSANIQKDIDSGEINELLEDWIPDFKELKKDLKENDCVNTNPSQPDINITNININNGTEAIDDTKDKTTNIGSEGSNKKVFNRRIALGIFLFAVVSMRACTNEGIMGLLNFNLNLNNTENNNQKTIIGEEKDVATSDKVWPTYAADEIDANVLDDRIVINSVGDERNFVAVRKDGNKYWQTDTVIVENNRTYDDEIYEICVRIKNDNPNGKDAIAKGTKVFLELQSGSAKTIPIGARIESENAKPQSYASDIKFSSRINFSLKYVEDSALLVKQGAKNEDGIKLGDIFNKEGVMVGHETLNGELPGGEEYALTIIFKVKVVFDAKDTLYTTSTKVRLADSTDKTWKDSVDAMIGDKVEFQIEYKNTSDLKQERVIIDDDLPSNLRYIPGTTVLYNVLHPKGAKIERDSIIDDGCIIGNYGAKTNAFVRFTAEVVNDNFTCGKYILRNWGRASIGEKVIQDSADVVIQLPHCPDLQPAIRKNN